MPCSRESNVCSRRRGQSDEASVHHIEELEEDVLERVNKLERSFNEQNKYLHDKMDDITKVLKTLQPNNEEQLRTTVINFQSQPSM